MKLRNVYLALKDQLPIKRFFRNFFITRNALGLFHKNSHIAQSTGKLKVEYGSRESAHKAAVSMKKKYGHDLAVYKCIWCDDII